MRRRRNQGTLPPGERERILRLERLWVRAREAAEQAYEMGDLNTAEELDEIAARAGELFEAAIEVADVEPGDIPEPQEPAEAVLARIYADWRVAPRGATWQFGSKPEFLRTLRLIMSEYHEFRPETTDEELEAAAYDAWKARFERLQRQKRSLM